MFPFTNNNLDKVPFQMIPENQTFGSFNPYDDVFCRYTRTKSNFQCLVHDIVVLLHSTHNHDDMCWFIDAYHGVIEVDDNIEKYPLVARKMYEEAREKWPQKIKIIPNF